MRPYKTSRLVGGSYTNNYAVIHRVRTNPLPLRFAMTILGAGHIKMKIT